MRRTARHKASVDRGASWISYSDMMAALILVFVLILCYSMYQYFTMLDTKTAELDEKGALLASQEATLQAQQATLQDQEATLQAQRQTLSDQQAKLDEQTETLSQQQAAEKLGKSQPAIANKLRLLRLGPPVTDCLRQYGLTERHARALLRLTDPEQQLAAARHMGQRGLNVAQAEQYIDALAARNRTEPLRRRPTYIIKDVRLFLNSVERGVRLMQSAGVGAEVGRCDTDEEILLTIHIPKRRPAGVVTDS